MTSRPEPRPGRPEPVEVAATWPAQRQLAIDLALAGAVCGVLLGFIGGQPAWSKIGIVIGLGGGALLGRELGPRRYVLRLDADGVHVGKLLRTIDIPWAEVGAFGVAESWSGRRGRLIGLAVCRSGADLPLAVPALTFREPGWGRIGNTPRPEQAIEEHRPKLLTPVRAWAEAMHVPTVATDIDSWWEIHQDQKA